MTQYLICISKLIVVTVGILMIRDKTGVNSFMDLALIQWGKKIYGRLSWLTRH